MRDAAGGIDMCVFVNERALCKVSISPMYVMPSAPNTTVWVRPPQRRGPLSLSLLLGAHPPRPGAAPCRFTSALPAPPPHP